MGFGSSVTDVRLAHAMYAARTSGDSGPERCALVCRISGCILNAFFSGFSLGYLSVQETRELNARSSLPRSPYASFLHGP